MLLIQNMMASMMNKNLIFQTFKDKYEYPLLFLGRIPTELRVNIPKSLLISFPENGLTPSEQVEEAKEIFVSGNRFVLETVSEIFLYCGLQFLTEGNQIDFFCPQENYDGTFDINQQEIKDNQFTEFYVEEFFKPISETRRKLLAKRKQSKKRENKLN